MPGGDGPSRWRQKGRAERVVGAGRVGGAIAKIGSGRNAYDGRSDQRGGDGVTTNVKEFVMGDGQDTRDSNDDTY